MKHTKIKHILQSNTITLARALLALSVLLTMVFTPISDLFPMHHLLNLRDNVNGIMSYNIFLLFDNLLIPYIFSLSVLILVIFGVYPRITSVLQALVTYSFFHAALIVEGGDQINSILTLLLIPISILDTRFVAWKSIKDIQINNNFLISNAKYSLLFISIQMAVIYFNAGSSKMYHTEWANGTAIYYWFFDNMFGAPHWMQNSIGFLFRNNITVSLISWSVIILQIFLFVGLFLNQKYKYILFIFGFVFHLLIALIHGLPTFGLSMTAGLILYFFRLDNSVICNLTNLKLIFKP